MLIDWIKLVPALVLLLTPIALFHGSHVRYRDVTREWRGYWGRTFGLGLHTIDLLRAAAGAWLLTEAFRRAPGAQGVMTYGVIVAQTAIFALATMLQTAICKEPESANAPFAFIAGLVLGYLPLLVSGFALVFAITIALGVRAPASYFPVLAAGVEVAGYFFASKRLQFELLSAASAALLPWLLILLFPRSFVSTHRARMKSTPVPPLR